MKKSKMTAVALRGILGTMIVIIIGLTGLGFYFAQNWLSDLAIDVSHTIADSTSSGNNIQALHKLQEELESRQDIISRANSLFTSKQTYQIQAVNDLTAYATATGISISNFTFPTTPTTTKSTTTDATTVVTLTLSNPVRYDSLIRFMQAIEGNLPKMQISSINLSRIEGDTQSVKIDQLTIAVSTR